MEFNIIIISNNNTTQPTQLKKTENSKTPEVNHVVIQLIKNFQNQVNQQVIQALNNSNAAKMQSPPNDHAY